MNDCNKYNYHYEERSDIPPHLNVRKGSLITIIVLAVIGVGCLCVLSAYAGIFYARQYLEKDNVVYKSTEEHPNVALRNGEQFTVAGVAQTVKDSVVEIVTEKVYAATLYTQYITSGAGSGVVWTEDGYIVTNYHVVQGTQTITVVLSDGDEYEASLASYDEVLDIALLKVAAQGLIPVLVGKSENLMVGEDIVAVGNPLGSLGGTVTNGIVSALDRKIIVDGEEKILLQTNAAVSPGHSGGGLFNMYGELIGIINAKSQGNGIEGIAFAIPTGAAEPAIRDLLERGYVRGRVNEDIIKLDEVYTSGGIIKQTGLRVAAVGTSKALPIQRNDFILAVNGQAVMTKAEWNKVLRNMKVGDTVVITYQKSGNSAPSDFSLVLEERTEPRA